MFQAAKDFFRSKSEPETAAVAWLNQNALTPDICQLEQSMFQLIFLPDDMMRGKNNNHLIADAGRDGDVPVHPACFTLERFTFWKKDLGVESFPIPMAKDYQPSNWVRVKPTPAKIKGQLYAIFSPRIKRLDIHRQNGVQFIRKRQEITLPYRNVKYDNHPDAGFAAKIPEISIEYIRTVEAWMYIGIPEYWDNLIGDIFQVRECNKFELDQPKFWIEEYYKF